MSTRFSRAERSVRTDITVGRGRPKKYKNLNCIHYRGYFLTYDYYPLIDSYLVSVSTNQLQQPILEFLVEHSFIQVRGVEKFFIAFLKQLYEEKENNEMINTICKLYGQDYSEVSDLQKTAFEEAQQLINNYFSKNS